MQFESARNTNTKAVSTPREKLQDKLVLDGRRSPILKKDEATRYRSACMRLYLADTVQRKSEACKMVSRRESQELHCDCEDKNTLTKSPSSWTAIALAIQLREKVLRELGLVTVEVRVLCRCPSPVNFSVAFFHETSFFRVHQ